MITEYHRPDSLHAALALLARSQPHTLPLGGGTVLTQPQASRQASQLAGQDSFAVVDLQALGLDMLESSNQALQIGATVTLEALLAYPELPAALDHAIRHEATTNLRQTATAAGTLVASDGRSPFCLVMLALDTSVEFASLAGGEETLSLGELLPQRNTWLPGRLITRLTIPLKIKLAYHFAARTPADRPLVAAAAAAWPSGRTRLALGGFGPAPTLVLDGPEPGGIELAAREAYSLAGDAWADAEYRSAAAAELAHRCLNDL
jgi:CO/xanthine dehydrogenase FAD-binding subunit